MTARHLVVLALALCAATPQGALTQAPTPAARVGDRIRVHRFDTRHPRTGKLISRSDDSLTVEWQNGAQESMPIFEVEQLDVSEGHRHYFKRGIMYGLVMGAGVGLLVRKFVDTDTSAFRVSERPTRSRLIGLVTGGGIAVGALAGAMGTEVWEPTPVRQSGNRTGIGGPSGPARLTIALSAKF